MLRERFDQIEVLHYHVSTTLRINIHTKLMPTFNLACCFLKNTVKTVYIAGENAERMLKQANLIMQKGRTKCSLM